MVTVFVLYFFYSVLMYFKGPAMSGEILESIRQILTDFIGSATAAASMFSIAFIFTSGLCKQAQNTHRI